MNPRLLIIAVGVGIGYVLGTRAGRERYDEMKAKATALWEDPRVAKARRDVEAYARQQAPIIRERAEAAAKAAPGVAKDVAANVSSTAKDVAANVSSTAKDVAANVSSTAKDVAGRVTGAAVGAREQAGKVASDLRDRGGAAIDTAVTNAGEARDRALAAIDDDDESPSRQP
ncbi:MAG: protoporphyrinogen oxidase [Rhodoglobus sp.]|nr:protoporphyrinogen oxidase [Rhodoglobus sp.]